MKNFIQTIKNSVYNPTFFRELERKDLSFSIFYLLKLSVLASTVATIIIIIFFHVWQGTLLGNAGVEKITDLSREYLQKYYPEDLVIKYADNVLSTNSTTEISFPIPFEWFGDIEKSENIKSNILTIATEENISKSSFENLDSYIILSSTTAGAYDVERGSIDIIDYKDENTESIPNIEITKDLALENTEVLNEYLLKLLPYLYIFLLLFTFIYIMLFVFFGTLIFAIFTAFLAWLIGKVWKKDMPFAVWYRKALHADTLYIVLAWTIGFLVPFTFIPFINTAFVLFVLFVNDSFRR